MKEMRVDWQTRLMVLSLAAVTLAWSGYTRTRWGFVSALGSKHVFITRLFFVFFCTRPRCLVAWSCSLLYGNGLLLFFLHVTHGRRSGEVRRVPERASAHV